MPDGLNKRRLDIFHQRLREALTFILREAAREEEERVNGRAAIAKEEPCRCELFKTNTSRIDLKTKRVSLLRSTVMTESKLMLLP
jgi:hypothetical protein